MKTTKLSLFNRGGSLLAALTAYHVVVAIFVLTLVTGAGSLIGSNMGFKATRDFNYNADVAALNKHVVALPHNNPWAGQGVAKGFAADSDYFLSDLCQGQTPQTLQLVQYDNSIPQENIQSYSSCTTFAGTPFNFVEGEAYQLNVSSGLSGVVLVGSQDPTFPPAGTKFTYNSDPAAINQFQISITPNTKWADANELLTAWCTGGVTMQLVQYDNSIPQENIQSYSSCTTFAGTNFSLVPFEGYYLNIGTTVDRTQEPYY